MFVRLFSIAAALCLLATSSPGALATPAATVALDLDVSGCEFGRLLITTSGISGGRQFRRATWSDAARTDIVLGQIEESGPATGYAGEMEFPFVAGPVPYGIMVTLYGYQGSTPPDPATTAEFALTYVCDTLEVVASIAGPYGTITPLTTTDVPPVNIPALSASVLLAVSALLSIAGMLAAHRRRG